MDDLEIDNGSGERDDTGSILGFLPHRYPFLFVDRVLEAESGRKAVAVLRVTSDTPYIGKAGASLLPDVLIIEAMAQVGAVAAAAGGGADGKDTVPVTGYLAAINGAEFSGRAAPGDTVTLTLEYAARLGNMVRFNGSAEVDGKEIVTCGLTFTVEEQRNA